MGTEQIINGGFENLHDTYFPDNWTCYDAQVAWDGTNHSGSWSIDLDTPNCGYCYQDLNVPVAKITALSYWHKSATWQQVRCTLTFSDSSTVTSDSGSNATWHQLDLMTSLSGKSGLNLTRIRFDSLNSGDVYVDDVSCIADLQDPDELQAVKDCVKELRKISIACGGDDIEDDQNFDNTYDGLLIAIDYLNNHILNGLGIDPVLSPSVVDQITAMSIIAQCFGRMVKEMT